MRLAALLLCLSSTALAQPAAPAVGKLEFKSGTETIAGYLAVPVATEAELAQAAAAKKDKKAKGVKRPGVVLIHEWWGLNDFIKQKTAELAAQGYIVLAPDLYRGKVASDPDTAHQLARGMPQDRAQRDLGAAIDELLRQPEIDSTRIGVVGWCMGGGLASELATREGRLKAVAIYYGSLPTDAARISQLKAAVLGNFGAEDRGIPEKDVRAFETQLKKQGNPVDIKIYPGAGHAFASSKKPEVFKADAAKDADARTAAFLAKWLKLGERK
jgi:carboxymethylenebutenolidase